jgi:hypothetical protein
VVEKLVAQLNQDPSKAFKMLEEVQVFNGWLFNISASNRMSWANACQSKAIKIFR